MLKINLKNTDFLFIEVQIIMQEFFSNQKIKLVFGQTIGCKNLHRSK